MPKFSIILPAYNSEPFIRETIKSITQQDYGDFELIVVDDGSRDNTAAIAAECDARVRVLRQENQGIAAARNAGLTAAQGEWIAFMDHDDLWHPRKLSAQAAILDAHPECGIVYSNFLRWDPATPPMFPPDLADFQQIEPALSGRILHRLVETNWVLLSTAVVRRTVFDRIGQFDTHLPPADDWDFVLRAAGQFDVIKLAQPLTLYRQHAQQTSRRLPSRNFEYELRYHALQMAQDAGGPMPDRRDIRQRQFRALFNHALAQYQAGFYMDSAGNFARSLGYNLSPRAAVYCMLSVSRALLPERRT